ncbi:MAG TPA: DnaJ domain-containing protein [Polyangiaceae bacterium]
MSLEATATGNLQATPFGHLLVYLLDRGMTGSLVLEEADGSKHAIWFDAGAPAKVKTATPVTYLGQVLVEQRVITREVYELSLRGALHTRRLHGEVLLETAAIDQRLLRDALREQLARQVLWLFRLAPTTLYGYYDQVNLLERWGAPEGLRVRPLALIWRGLRRHASPAEIESVTARLGQRPIELHVDAPIRRFRFESSEQSLIDVLRAKPQSLASLIASGLATPDEVKRLVYALVILRQLELGVPGAEPVGVDEAPSSSRMPIAPAGRVMLPERDNARGSIPDIEHVVPRASSEHGAATPVPIGPSSTPAPAKLSVPAAPRASLKPGVVAMPPGTVPSSGTAELRLELEAIFERLGGTHYEVLGVPKDATVNVIQNVFFSLAKKWHPDRLRSELADVKAQATRVFARVSEASQVLSDPSSRQEYDQSLSHGLNADEAEQVHKVLKATSAFQKAEVLLKRGNLALAEKEALIAFENDPTQADHVAIHVWIQAQKPGVDLGLLTVELEKAVKAEPNNLRVRWYRGQLFKRLGRVREALHDFRFIVERDPRHTDAHREVRLYAMRRGSRPPSKPPDGKSLRPAAPDSQGSSKNSPSSKPGLLNKLFKKP